MRFCFDDNADSECMKGFPELVAGRPSYMSFAHSQTPVSNFSYQRLRYCCVQRADSKLHFEA